MRTIASTDGVTIALHDFGGTGPTLLFSHATGLHGHCYRPMATHLGGRFHSFALDYRGHGDSTAPASGSMQWSGFAEDAAAVIRALAPRVPFYGFGHSKGGVALVAAEIADPGTFTALVLFEPVLIPRDLIDPTMTGDASMADRARRRRAEFDSFDAAVRNFASKPPLNTLRTDALDAYVRHGFRSTDHGTVTLKCTPETEARTFDHGRTNGVYERLAAVRCPVLVLGGSLAEAGPAAMVERVAAALPNAEHRRFDQLSHFGPVEDPDLVADTAAAFFDRHPA